MESVTPQDSGVAFLVWILIAGFGGLKTFATGRHLLAGGTLKEGSHEYEQWRLYINCANLLRGKPHQDYITAEQMKAIGRIDIAAAWVLFATIPLCLILAPK